MKGGNVVVEAKQSIGRLVTADASVVKVDVALGIPCEEKVLHILGVEALVGDRVAEKHQRVAILEVQCGRWCDLAPKERNGGNEQQCE